MVSPSVPFRAAVPLSTWRQTKPTLCSRSTSENKDSSAFPSSSPWCPPQFPYPWWPGGRACRCLTSGRASRGRRWLRPHSWTWRHQRRRGCHGKCGGSPRCSPRWYSAGASPWFLNTSRRGHFSRPPRIRAGCTSSASPVDSSAARIPFPGATILWAMSESSFFCSGDSDGYWWVILEEIKTSTCDSVDNMEEHFTFHAPYPRRSLLVFLPLLRRLCKYLAWTVVLWPPRDTFYLVNAAQIYISLTVDNNWLNISLFLLQ